MSANLDLVRSIYADWERGDFFNAADWAHPEVEFVAVDGSQPGSFRGLAELSKTWRDRLSAFEDARLKAEQYRELDDERVLVFYSMTGRGKTSGLDLADLDRHYVHLFHIRDGRVTRLVVYWDADRARESPCRAPQPLPSTEPRLEVTSAVLPRPDVRGEAPARAASPRGSGLFSPLSDTWHGAVLV